MLLDSWERHLRAENKSPATISSYLNDTRHLLDVIGAADDDEALVTVDNRTIEKAFAGWFDAGLRRRQGRGARPSSMSASDEHPQQRSLDEEDAEESDEHAGVEPAGQRLLDGAVVDGDEGFVVVGGADHVEEMPGVVEIRRDRGRRLVLGRGRWRSHESSSITCRPQG